MNKIKKIKFLLMVVCMLLINDGLKAQINPEVWEIPVLKSSDRIAKLPNGDLFVTATKVVNNVEKLFISRCNSAGLPIWTKELSYFTSARINSLIIDASGNAGFCGSFEVGGIRKAFLAKVDMTLKAVVLSKVWQENSTEANLLIASASGKEYIVVGQWTTSTPGLNGSTPSIFVASVDITSNNSGISWFEDIYERLRGSGAGTEGKFIPTAMCEMKDGYGICFYREYVTYRETQTFMIKKNGALITNSSGVTHFRTFSINFNRTAPLGEAGGIVWNMIGDINSNSATLFYVTESKGTGSNNPEEGIVAVQATYPLNATPFLGSQSFLRLPKNKDYVRVKSIVYDNNEAILAGSIGIGTADGYLVRFNRASFNFTNSYRLNYGTSDEGEFHICGSPNNFFCSFTSNGFGPGTRLLVGQVSLANLNGVCQFSDDLFDNTHTNYRYQGVSLWNSYNKLMQIGVVTDYDLTLETHLQCQPCPEVIHTDSVLTYCSPLQNKVWWSPCDFLNNGSRFEIVNTTNGNSNIEYDSEVGYAGYTGCFRWQFNLNNTYDINYYNELGCLVRVLHITVQMIPITDANPVYIGPILVDCGTDIDLMNYPFAFNPNCGVGYYGRWLDANNQEVTSPQNIKGQTHFKLECYNLSTCERTTTNVTFDVNLPPADSIELHFCSPLQSKVWWSPCDYFNGSDHFEILNTTGGGSNIEYNSEIGYGGYSGCLRWQFNIGNSYKINYYDDNGCITKILNVKVKQINITDVATYTLPTQIVNCPYLVDLNTHNFGPLSIACNGPGMYGKWVDALGNNVTTPQLINGTTDFVYECYNLNTCTRTKTNVRFRCHFEDTPPPSNSNNNNAYNYLSNLPEVNFTPNPSSDIFKINFRNNSPIINNELTYSLIVIDMMGKIIFEIENAKLDSNFIVDLSAYSTGIYTAKISIGEKVQYVKLIKN